MNPQQHDQNAVDLSSITSVESDMLLLPTEEMQQDRKLKADRVCAVSEALQTPNEADTVVSGTMFTIQSHNDPISIITMEICANPIESSMQVQIYTKGGDFKGVENHPSKWIKIVDTSIFPAREGRGTLIPTDDFMSFTMNPNEVRAFFVSIKTSDLRYRQADDFDIAQPFVSDGYLSMNVGIGLADPGFGNRVFPSRMFSGIVHYTRLADCDAPDSKTVITYTFHVTPKARAAGKSEITDEVHNRVSEAIRDILKSDLSDLSDDHTIGVDGIETGSLVFERGTLQGWFVSIIVVSVSY